MANDDSYGVEALVADLRRIRADCATEHDVIARVRPIARRAALAKDTWFEPRMLNPDPVQGYSPYVLHEEPDHTLAVIAVSWCPGRGTPAHDHGTWAVVAGVDGPETNTFWRRTDDGSREGYAALEQIGEKVFMPGDVLAMPTGTIHAVWNRTDGVTLSLHLYGVHINHTGRFQFDPERHTVAPLVTKMEPPRDAR
jgi:predicted metal-dependent enzyme (double-stranded beta helix superfamily)